MIEKIIQTIKFCKRMGISYVEFDVNTNINITQGEMILLREFLNNNNCEVAIAEKGIRDFKNGIIIPNYQLNITINNYKF